MIQARTINEVVTFVYGHPRTTPLLLSLLGCFALQKLIYTLWKKKSVRNKINSRREKAEKRKKLVEARCLAKVSPSSEEIIKKSASELLEALKSGDLSAVDVLYAYQRKALSVTKEINCIVEFIPEAEEQAKRLDECPTKTGLLHGMPISLKENLPLTGYDNTAGMEINIDKKVTEDYVVVQVLKLHGAIPFARTNIPQTMLSYCCENPLYGETLNPQDKTRCPGGSSGGEGAIIGGGGSLMGIGTDIGGSARIPAEFCGIYSLKPTRGRISSKNYYTPLRGNLAIQGAVGPMARNFDALLILSQALMSPEMYELDRSLPPLPFDKQKYEKRGPLRIGFYTFDGTFECLPPVVRAVHEAKKALELMGHEVVPFDFPKILGSGFKNADFFVRIMMADRGVRLRKMLKNDELALPLRLMLKLGALPVWLVKAIAFIASFKDPFGASILGCSVGFDSIPEFFDHVTLFQNWQEEFMKAWRGKHLDAVICPVFPSPAPTRDVIHKVTPCGLYCQLYNSLDYPAGVIPVTTVNKEDLKKTFDENFFPANSVIHKLLLKSTKTSEGISVGVQCVALPFQEEICLRVMRDLNRSLQENKDYIG